MKSWTANCSRGLVVVFFLLASPYLQAATDQGIRFFWKDPFSDQEKRQLESWVIDTQNALESLVGVLPRPMRIQMRRSPASQEPVPWGQTIREQPQGVLFVVDMRHSDRAFRNDWTASHELSHLAFPYLGRPSAWFSEGFATYMQYAVMEAMGTMSAQQVRDKREQRIHAANRAYPYPDAPFATKAQQLHANGYYSVLYWGGTSYFMRVDAELQARDSSLIQIVREYVSCCRRNHDQLDHLIETLDQLVGGKPVFEPNRRRLLEEPGFPTLFRDRSRPAGR